MKLRSLTSVIVLMALLGAGPVFASGISQDTYHQDHRSTPKLQIEPDWDAPVGLNPESTATVFVEQMTKLYQLPTDSDDLVLIDSRESLLGFHYTYQQRIHGINVQGGTLVVSIAKKDNRVYRVFNNTYPVTEVPQRTGAISSERALDSAWQRLRVHGDLTSLPLVQLVYTPVADGFRLNYIVDLAITAPYGEWRQSIDAATGSVLTVEDSRLIRKVNPDDATVEERLAEYNGTAWDRLATTEKFAARQLQASQSALDGARAAGTGIVFDPDPRTTLRDNSLQDGNPAGDFTDAYFTRDLLDITFSDGVYRLTGDWVNIVSWDPPSTPPSTTLDGNWTATRGDNSFNDAMTYFHLDQSQRHMQSMGFTGATGIQELSIVVDTDGVNGADNSYYVPSTNRLSFGHGCVDDNEDADVILHEYGHAIQRSINSNWNGGDTGAMGEGFGDYWAGSYSYSTPNGPVFFPNYMFTWDGHGAGNQCWNGRIMDAFGAQYDHNTTYPAHSGIPGGYVSDELWSTPLFQSLIALTDLGRPRYEVDQIILEAHFGLGSGLKMRDMANAIIATAQAMFPEGPHADVFIEKFLVHNIVVVPHVDLVMAHITQNSDSPNGVVDPGESVGLTIALANVGNLAAENVSATLSTSTAMVNITNESSAYPRIRSGTTEDSLTEFSLEVDSGFTCGDFIHLVLVVSFDGEKNSETLNFELGTGVPIGAAESVSPGGSIPDNNSSGYSSELVVSGSGANVTSVFNVDVDITHTYIGDLRVKLTSPSGTDVFLHNRSGGSADDIVGNYPNTLTPAGSLSDFEGEPLDGTWTLLVTDHAGQDVGTLNSWGINDVSGYTCDDAVSPVSETPVPISFAVKQNHPNPFNPSTTISFDVPEDAGVVTLAIYDISGRLVKILESSALLANSYQRVWNGRDSMGRSVGSGVYFYRLEGKGFSEARKMIMIQ